ncbi:hypothetical protein HAPAU_07630 [Halalkalicoccus paucihalophilus]|uniref:Small CPxCG-related zinc finger protein n=1 Tax=Halalkalicoccus paucihalophilus TaxID=1008153 RepID=A0A151AGT4_9EURY|nr:hypothetical protein [Halalkalicoccus paucihalophilus]KYH26876.1 hypothetical protein HAPAU_07630 [Halalkalicoccus paucihalophilus]
MVRCNRCDGYVSRDYARVFGDNDDQVASCPNCPVEWVENEDGHEERPERKLTFKMSEFETDDGSSTTGRSEALTTEEGEGSETEPFAGRFGRVGKAVSGLF